MSLEENGIDLLIQAHFTNQKCRGLELGDNLSSNRLSNIVVCEKPRLRSSDSFQLGSNRCQDF